MTGEWLRYLCRKDDLLVHTSGEMTNPLVTEQRVLATCAAMLTEGGAVLCGNGMPRASAFGRWTTSAARTPARGALLATTLRSKKRNSKHHRRPTASSSRWRHLRPL